MQYLNRREGLFNAGFRRFYLRIGESTRESEKVCTWPDLAATRGYAAGGYAQAMHLAAEVLAARSTRSHVPGVRIARLYAHAGENDQVMKWLEKAYEQRETPLVHLNVAWDWDNLRDDPRFQDLLRRMNFPQ